MAKPEVDITIHPEVTFKNAQDFDEREWVTTDGGR
jgi:hypothetical protein